MSRAYPKECYKCGHLDCDYGCTCPSIDMWYSCPIESRAPENRKALEDMAKSYIKKVVKDEQDYNQT